MRWRAVLLAGVAACVDVTDGPREHAAPRAVLRLPVTAAVGSPVELDGSASSDANGDVLTYVFEILGYGEAAGTVVSESTEPLHSHTFAHTGIYTVRLRVTDAARREALAVQDIIVRNNPTENAAPCDAPSDCVLGDVCESGVCFSVGGSVD